MDTNVEARLLIPIAKVGILHIPALSISGGTQDPEWVDLPCASRQPYARAVKLRLPLDAASASNAYRWIRFRQLERVVLLPLAGMLFVAGFAARYSGILDASKALNLEIVLWLTGLALLWFGRHTYGRLAIPQHPTIINRRDVTIQHVPLEVAEEWTNVNPDVRVVRW